METKSITIIIPALNEAENLAALIPYLQDKGQPFVGEIVVVDGGSTDQTVETCRRLGSKVIHSSQKNRAFQMNMGAAAAQTPILYFVHADTIPPPTFARRIVAYLDAPGKMGCFRYVFRSKSRMLRFNAWFTRFRFLWCQGGDKTFFIRRSCFFEMGGYDPYYQIMEEYDFLKRALRHHHLDVLPDTATVSARKYEKNSWLRVQIANILVFQGWRIGIQPKTLHRFYKNILS